MPQAHGRRRDLSAEGTAAGSSRPGSYSEVGGQNGKSSALAEPASFGEPTRAGSRSVLLAGSGSAPFCSPPSAALTAGVGRPPSNRTWRARNVTASPLLAVAPAGGRGDPQPGDLGAGGQLLELDVAGQVPRQGGGGDVTHVFSLIEFV
jgi:hypothetical protein